jgi:hypothetical protein
MPAPDKKMFLEMAKQNFLAKAIKLPMEWSQPGDQYPDAFKPSERMKAPNSPTTLFLQATLNKYHVKTAKEMGDKYEKFLKGITEAICDAVDQWLKLAQFTTAIINGPCGVVTPGSLMGPPLTPLIMAKAPNKTPQELLYSQAVATAFGTAWLTWQSGLMGQLMYPAFAAFPGPMAPPTPNVPVPLITFTSPGEAQLSPAVLAKAMEGVHGDPLALHAADLFDALAKAWTPVFTTFKSTTLVQNVLGTGPIPTFAPPFVPVGPVVAGFLIPKPGVFS